MNNQVSKQASQQPTNPSINQASHSPNPRVVPRASSALDVQRLLIGDFQDRWEVAKQLTRQGDRVLPALLSLLDEAVPDDDELVWFIARILGDIHHPDALQALTTLVELGPEQPEVAQMAALGLANHGRSALDSLTRLAHRPTTQPFAVVALAQIQTPEATNLLRSLTQNPEPTVRAAAIEALVHCQHPEMQTLLMAALTDFAAVVRLAALGSLSGRLRGLSPTEAAQLASQVQPLLGDFNLGVAQQAALLLGCLNDPLGVEALVASLTQELPLPLRLQVLRSLGWSAKTSPAALTALAQELEHQLSLAHRLEEARYLSREIIIICGNIAAEAASASTQILVQWLERLAPADLPDLRQAIAMSLGYLGQPEAMTALQALSRDPNPGVRVHAIASLKRLGQVF